MKLQSLDLRNFRQFEETTVQFHPNFNVLIGENGCGKTTVLDAIAISLGAYFQSSGIRTGHTGILKKDRRLVTREKGGQVFFEPQSDVLLRASALVNATPISWQRELGDRAGKAKALVEQGLADRKAIQAGQDPVLPLLLYYGAGRLWEIHRDIPIGKPGSQLDGYRFCLDPKSDQKAFQKWFKQQSLTALLKGKKAPSLQALQDAVITCIPKAEEFYLDPEVDQIVIKLEDGSHAFFDNLSDGYRNMVAMVADMAYRTTRLNPQFERRAALETPGVVLIDEIDLHLHPKWQRSVVRDLQRAFPKVQFIVTTHSPFIMQSLEPNEMIDLDPQARQNSACLDHDGSAMPAPRAPYANRSIEDIVEEVMNVPVPQRSLRYQEMYDVAVDYFKLLEEMDGADEVREKELKAKLDRLSAPFSDNQAYHAFLETKRLVAEAKLNSGRDIKA